MTPERLAEIRRRVEATPRGPWFWTAGLTPAAHQLVTNGAALDIATCTEDPDGPATIAEFIAHARTDVPDLLDALESQREEIRPLRALAEWLASLDGPAGSAGAEERRTVMLVEIIDRATAAMAYWDCWPPGEPGGDQS
jgi:hypothetical protein